jgi:multidrug efflux pump subunit AcrA (membrane-fusion protein)
VAVVDEAGKVSLRPVKLGRNRGESVEILDGVATSDRLVLNPSDALADGDVVRATAAPVASSASGAGKGASGAAGKPASGAAGKPASGAAGKGAA